MNKNVTLSVLGAVVLAGSLSYYFLTRQPSMEDTAEDFGALLFRGDGRRLYGEVHPLEIRLNDLDSTKVRGIVEAGMRPSLSSADLLRFQHEFVNDEHLATQMWVKRDGREFPIVLHVFKTAQGNKVLLGVTVKSIWEAVFIYGEGKTFSEGNFHRAMLKGIETESEHLETLGLLGTVSNDPEADELVTWSRNKAYSESVLRKLESSE